MQWRMPVHTSNTLLSLAIVTSHVALSPDVRIDASMHLQDAQYMFDNNSDNMQSILQFTTSRV